MSIATTLPKTEFFDGPNYEAEIVGDRCTVRATVGTTDDGLPYGTLAAEPNEGPLQQYTIEMTAASWTQLAMIASEAARQMEAA